MYMSVTRNRCLNLINLFRQIFQWIKCFMPLITNCHPWVTQLPGEWLQPVLYGKTCQINSSCATYSYNNVEGSVSSFSRNHIPQQKKTRYFECRPPSNSFVWPKKIKTHCGAYQLVESSLHCDFTGPLNRERVAPKNKCQLKSAETK